MEHLITRSQLIWTMLALLAGFSVYLIAPVLTPFFIAAFIAYVSNPGVTALEDRGVPRWVSMVSGLAVLLVVLSIISLLLLPALKTQLSNYIDRIPDYLDQFHQWTDPFLDKMTSVAADVTNMEEEEIGSVTDLAKQALPDDVGTGAGAATISLAKASTSMLVQIVTNIFLIPVIAFYLLRDWNNMTTSLKRMLPLSQRTRVVSLAREVDKVLKSFLHGQLLVMMSLGVMYSVGLTLIGLEFSLLIGVVAGILSFVPFLGTAIGLLMASMAMITQTDHLIDLWKVFAVFGVGQFIEGNILTPKLVGEQLGLHPVIVIFSVLAGGHLFGFTGILLALPVAAVLWVVVKNVSEGVESF